MKFLLHSGLDGDSVRHGLGVADYSYRFVLEGYRSVLEKFGEVFVVSDPEAEVDRIYDAALAEGEDCIFLSFAPPHKTPSHLRCPTVPVFAWEFSTLPDTDWGDDPRNDWRYVFARHGRAITLSHYTANIVRDAMGENYPIAAIPTATYTRFAAGSAGGIPSLPSPTVLQFNGYVLDSANLPLTALMPVPALRPEDFEEKLQEEDAEEAEVTAAPLPNPISLVPPSADLVLVEPACPDMPSCELAPLDPPQAAVQDISPAVVSPRPPFRREFRRRLSITHYYAVAWYREVLRDLLPRPVAWSISRSGRLVHRSYRICLGGLRTAIPVPAVPVPAVAAMPTIEPVVEVVVSEVPVAGAIALPAVEIIAESLVEPVVQALPSPSPSRPRMPRVELRLEGVVYTAVFNPADGRKNWYDIVTGFCWAFREVEDAVLVLKMANGNPATWWEAVHVLLRELSPFKCRVVVVHGFLEDADYRALIAATSFYVNASLCEGLCLPLMEFMSAGRPAIAPDHTAMADYVGPDAAFVLRTGIEHNVWPHDPRDLFRTFRYRMDWESLAEAYRASYRTAREEPVVYARMAAAARARMQQYCSSATVELLLRDFLKIPAPDLIGADIGATKLLEERPAIAPSARTLGERVFGIPEFETPELAEQVA